jgi:parvulin-like peptidyl-prolyl isomerase
MQTKTRVCMGALVALAAAGLIVAAQPRPSPAVLDGRTIVAKVGTEPILAAQVERLVNKATGGQNLSPAALPFVQAQVLAEIVQHRLVMGYAQRQGDAPSSTDIDAALAALKAALAAQGKSYDHLLKAESLGEEEIRAQLAWRIVWDKYRQRYATPGRVEAHFGEHRRQFDGTQLLVSHILWQPPPRGGAQAVVDLLQQARSVRAEIVAGRTSFIDAARRHSAAPSARTGGQLGWISRRGEMDEALCRAAFALEPGQTSEPVRTRFGVHLVHCDDVRQGTLQANDVRQEVENSLGRELLEKLSAVERKRTAVEFTGAMPYFNPGSGEIVLP